MRAYTPLNKPSRELLLDLVNSTNAISPPLTFEDISFDPPVKLAPVLVNIFKSNTKVIIKDNESAGYVNSRLVYYDRVAIGSLFTDEEVVVTVDFLNAEEALAAFNEAYGLSLELEEVESIDLVNDRRVELTIGTSYVYTEGSKLALNANTELTRLEDDSHKVWFYANYTLPLSIEPV